MITKEFSYNDEAHYAHGSVFKKKAVDIKKQNIVITSDGKYFQTDFLNIFEKYILPKVASEGVVNDWNENWLKFWQNQLNFAIWCATTGCGVDYNNHLKADGLTGSLFLFHLYYQTRRILFELGIALPQDKSWNAFDNSYNRGAYERICKEFNVDINVDWRQKLYPGSNGLGDVYTTGHVSWKRTDFRHDRSNEHIENKKVSNLDLSKMTFGPEVPGGRKCGISSCKYLPSKKVHINYIKQNNGVIDAWTTFILDNSKGFTRAGIERINESIRTYCWAILGSQSQTKTDILGTGTAFDAQKQFLVNVEDVINSPVDLPSQIQRYQDTLKYARSKVDYVFGNDLYMSPSNMEMQIGTIQDYNNEIKIATNDQKLGLNIDINSKPVPPKQINKIEGKTTKTNNKPVKSARSAEPIKPTEPKPIAKNESKNISIQHEDNKTALIVGSIVVSLGALLIYEYS